MLLFFNINGVSYLLCPACECNMTGSYHDQCDLYSGQCPCKPNVEGMQCQKCVENKYNMSAGCVGMFSVSIMY